MSYYEIPYFGLRAYSLFFSKFGTARPFSQSQLDFVVSEPMKKKVFALLLNAGWIRKAGRSEYFCNRADEIFLHLLDFRVPSLMAGAKREYAFTGASAIEIWSDYSYLQRGRERSPYFIKVLQKDIGYWKAFFSAYRVPTYVGKGSTIGEFMVFIPCKSMVREEKGGLFVDSLQSAMREAGKNELFSYPYEYMRRKYGN